MWKTIACHTLAAFRNIQPHIRKHIHHLETLRIDALTTPCVSGLLQELSPIQVLPHVTSLSFRHIRITVEQLSDLLKKLPQLKEIDIRGTVLYKHPLVVLAQCKNIESMALSYEDTLLPEGFDLSTAFSPWKRLRRLSIIIWPETGSDDTLRQFEDVIRKSQLDLESLELSVPYWGADTITGIIERNSSLKRLVLSDCNLSEQGWTQVLPSLASLQSIAFQCNGVHTMESRMRVLQACPLIQHIDLKGFNISNQHFMVLAETASALTSLTLNNCQFASDGLRLILDQCTELEHLQVHDLTGKGAIKDLFHKPWACNKLQELVFNNITWSPYDMCFQELVKDSLQMMWTTLRKLNRLRILTMRHINRTDSIGLGIHWLGAPLCLEQLCLTGHGPWKQEELTWIAEKLPWLDELEYNDKEMNTTLQSWLRKNRPDLRLVAPTRG